MKQRIAHASGKIILSGEYAVLLGYTGIGIPSKECIHITHTWDKADKKLTIKWKNDVPSKDGTEYAQTIIREIEKYRTPIRGTVTIHNSLPLGKGMGSSTALIIALCRCMFESDALKHARRLEDALNLGHSGLDFAIISTHMPVEFCRETGIKKIESPIDGLHHATLIDTGTPHETTVELIAWIKSREKECAKHLQTIGNCTERIIRGEKMQDVIRDHHRAQAGLGVVPKNVQKLIATIEADGGAAKVIGAGAKTGKGAGMVLILR